MFKSYDIMICSVFGCFGPGLKLFHQGLAAQTIFMALEVVNGPQLQLFQFLLISLGLIWLGHPTISIRVRVTGISNAVPVHVLLITVRNIGAVITNVSDFIAISIFLMSVINIWAVVLRDKITTGNGMGLNVNLM